MIAVHCGVAVLEKGREPTFLPHFLPVYQRCVHLNRPSLLEYKYMKSLSYHY